MAKNEKKERERFPVSPTKLAAFASRLNYIASRYSEIAAQAQKRAVERLMVTGEPTALRGEKFLLAWMKSLQAALDASVMGQSLPETKEEIATNLDGLIEKNAKTTRKGKGEP